MDTEAEIKKEKRRLTALFRGVPEGKKKLTAGLIEEAAFMSVTLAQLREAINTDGPIVYGQNGNGFEIKQEHPAQKSYNVMISRYTSVIKALADLLPGSKEDSVRKAGEALAAFVAAGKP